MKRFLFSFAGIICLSVNSFAGARAANTMQCSGEKNDRSEKVAALISYNQPYQQTEISAAIIGTNRKIGISDPQRLIVTFDDQGRSFISRTSVEASYILKLFKNSQDQRWVGTLVVASSAYNIVCTEGR